MPYTERWQALVARIRGLRQAGELHARFLAVQKSDSYRRGRRLSDYCKALITDLRSFLADFGDAIPTRAANTLGRFLDDTGDLIEGGRGSTLEDHALQHALVVLTGLEAELSYLFSDNQEAIRSRADLAFFHLQRMLAVDQDLRSRWLAAFEEGETKCEQLAGIHLLWHGIWAFKVSGEGARTDLVYSEPLDFTVRSGARGLVLTEWKKADRHSAEQKFREAREQAKLYSEGVLASVELRNYRYAVVVSEEDVNFPLDDVIDGPITYRQINISLTSRVPSQRAVKNARRTRHR